MQYEPKHLAHFFLFVCTFFMSLGLQAQPCTGSPTNIGGVAFKDFNSNGVKDATDGLLAGIEIKVYDCAGALVGSDISDANGNWFMTVPIAPSASAKYRVEFTIPTALVGLQPSASGTGNKTDVQFVSAASCTVNFGVNYPSDYCQDNPKIVTPCYINGTTGTDTPEDVLVAWDYDAVDMTHATQNSLATKNLIGSTWGVAYSNKTNHVYAAAFLKRHVGIGSGGLGAIYNIDTNTGVPNGSPFITVPNVGSISSNATRGLTTPAAGNTDTEAFGKVGEVGLGDIDISEDQTKLYVVNLFTKEIVIIDIASQSIIANVSTPNLGCADGVNRPFGLKVLRNKLLVGSICDASNSAILNETTPNLEAFVHEMDMATNTFNATPALAFSLNYLRSPAYNETAYGGTTGMPRHSRLWYPWKDTFTPTTFNAFTGGSTYRISHPTPILSDIEIDTNGDMILGFSDRTSHQIANNNNAPDFAISNKLEYVISGGDILKANYNGNTWNIETLTYTAPTDATTPAEAEFFKGEEKLPYHKETAQGGLLLLAGKGEVVTTALDPINLFSGGILKLSTSTGNKNTVYEVFSGATFEKATGIGDLTALCTAAPIEIGNYVWLDIDRDGIQDACENPLAGVQVSLYTTDGTLVATKTTDGTGNYYFKDYQQYGAGFDTLAPNTQYYVVVGKSGSQFNTGTNQLTISGTSYTLTAANTGQTPNTDQNDSDGTLASSLAGALGTAINGFPYITITTSEAGYVNHSLDFGFFVCPTINNPNPNQSVCIGSAGSNITVQTNQNTASSIKFVKFITDQMSGVSPTATEAAAIYGGTPISTVTPTGGSNPYTATYTWNSTDFPNVTNAAITYYVYAIIEPDGEAGCHPTQEVQITVSPLVNAGTATNPAPICQNGSGLGNIDLFGQLASEMAGGTWSQSAGTTVGAALDASTGILNPNGLVNDTYTFRYTLIGIAPCPTDTEDVTLIIQKCCLTKICLPVTITKN